MEQKNTKICTSVCAYFYMLMGKSLERPRTRVLRLVTQERVAILVEIGMGRHQHVSGIG